MGKVLGLVAVLAASPAMAMLSGYYDSAEKITAILQSDAVADAVRQGAIGSISNTGTAADGAEALEVVRRERPDVVLMDLQMPGVDGVAATRAIRALPGPVARTPIIALTANAMAHLTADEITRIVDTLAVLRSCPAEGLASVGERHARAGLLGEAGSGFERAVAAADDHRLVGKVGIVAFLDRGVESVAIHMGDGQAGQFRMGQHARGPAGGAARAGVEGGKAIAAKGGHGAIMTPRRRAVHAGLFLAWRG